MTVQLPAATIDTVAVVVPPDSDEAPTEHTPAVALRPTTRPELADSEMVNDDSPYVLPASAAKVIVCAALAMV